VVLRKAKRAKLERKPILKRLENQGVTRNRNSFFFSI